MLATWSSDHVTIENDATVKLNFLQVILYKSSKKS